MERFKSIILTDHTHVDDLTSLMRRLADIEQKRMLAVMHFAFLTSFFC